jgi:hypothetical protein
LLDKVKGSRTSFIGDGPYDRTGIYGTITKRHPDVEVIVTTINGGVE